MAKRGENIYRRKDGRWEGRYIKYRSGNKCHYGYVYAKTYKETKLKLIEKRNSTIQEPSEAEPCRTHESKIIFSEISQEWIDFKKNLWKKSSYSKYLNMIHSYLNPRFSDKEIRQITREEVILFKNYLLEKGGQSGKSLSPKTVTDIMIVLRSIFEYASQEKGIELADISRIQIKQSQKPMRVLSQSEQQQLSRYLYENLDCCNLGILVCLYTGLRIGEICALKWEDISLNEQFIYVHSTMQRLQVHEANRTKTEILITPPKSSSATRKVPLPDNLIRILKEQKRYEEAYFLTGSPDRYVEPRTMHNHFKNAIKNCQIESVNYHVLRHTFATRCIELGFDVKSLSEILGHANVNITMNRYVHPSMELKKKNMDMLSELIAVNL